MRLERLPQRGSGIVSLEETLVGPDNPPCFRLVFTQEFNPESPRAGLDQFREISGTCLCLSVEESVPTSAMRGWRWPTRSRSSTL